MNIIVQKFGGTSVSTPERRKQVINKVEKAIKDGYTPVVVVSAMGRKGEPYATDTLLSLIDESFKMENKQATDLLMGCGEIISSVVMTNELKFRGIKAMPLTGGQAGIITNSNFSEAELNNVKTDNILSLIERGFTPVVTGFQGIDENGYLTTLGRGGSDTSAAILGVALNAKEVQIYTDVDGIMTADPRIVKKPALIDKISYNEVFQLADQGAKVIHPRAVEVAMKGNITLVIKNTLSECEGTLINNFGDVDGYRIISGITHMDSRIQIKVSQENNDGNKNYKEILNTLAKNNISLDLINIFPKDKIFTIDAKDKSKLIDLLDSINIKFDLAENCSKVSIIGSGMKGIPGVMAKLLVALDSEGIEVLQTADSHTTIWCLIHSEKVNKAINILHNVFMG